MDEYKQAYLILAHKSDYLFDVLLNMLDKEENDIYVHMDIKNKDFDSNLYKGRLKNANIFFTKRTNVNWGGYSLANAEIILIKEALKHRTDYNYLHLLSAQDLPIKNSEYIKDFFIKNKGKEFIEYEKSYDLYDFRTRYYYFFQELIKRDNYSIANRLQNGFIIFQKSLNFKRNKNVEFKKGSNWFSITSKLANYIVENENLIKKLFKYTKIPDEAFLQTIVFNSKFKDSVYSIDDDSNKSTMRLIDWKRGSPYIFKYTDLKQLKESQMIFARKFDPNIDKDIINAILEMYS